MDKDEVIHELIRINENSSGDEQSCKEVLQEKFKNLNRNRYFQFWHDGSTVSNHSHLLIAINCLYDPAIHYTDDEYKEKFGKHVNVQSLIEKPEIYIVARCQGDDHQLLYSECRNQDIKAINKDKIDLSGTKMQDNVRFSWGWAGMRIGGWTAKKWPTPMLAMYCRF